MSSLAHRSAAAPASTSRAGRHMRQTCLVRLRLHLGPRFRSAAVRLLRHAAPPCAPCAAAPPPRARSRWPSRRCFARRWSRTSGSSSRQLWHRRRTAGHRLCAVTACSTPTRSCRACWMPSLRHLRTFSEQPVSSAKVGQASARFASCTRRRMDALRHRGVRCRAPKPVRHAAGRVPRCSPATCHTTAFAMPPRAVSTPQIGPAYSLLSDAATIDRCHRPKREAKLQLSVGVSFEW